MSGWCRVASGTTEAKFGGDSTVAIMADGVTNCEGIGDAKVNRKIGTTTDSLPYREDTWQLRLLK